MTVRAVGDYVTTLLNGQTFGNFPTVVAKSELPGFDQAATHPKIYVWPSKGNEKRYAMPRTQGLKKTVHSMAVYVILAMKPTPILSFKDLIEGIMNNLRTSPMPVIGIVDSVTGETSNIEFIGEDMEYQYDQPAALKTQRLTEYRAVVIVDIHEYFKG